MKFIYEVNFGCGYVLFLFYYERIPLTYVRETIYMNVVEGSFLKFVEFAQIM